MLKNKRYSGGFTFMEMAIILVVVSLVVGAVIVGYSLITSAKTTNLVKQVTQFSALQDQFTSKYRSIPGDSRKFYDVASSEGFNLADADGFIEDAEGFNQGINDARNGTGLKFTGEIANYWSSLEAAGGITDNASYSAIVNGKLKVGGADANVPATKLGLPGTGAIGLNDFVQVTHPDSLRRKKIAGAYIIGKMDNITPTSVLANSIEDSFSPIDMIALETKLDDGDPKTGIVLAYSQSGKCLSGDKYDSGVKDPACWMAIGFDTYKENPNCATCDSCSLNPTKRSADCESCEPDADRKDFIDNPPISTMVWDEAQCQHICSGLICNQLGWEPDNASCKCVQTCDPCEQAAGSLRDSNGFCIPINKARPAGTCQNWKDAPVCGFQEDPCPDITWPDKDGKMVVMKGIKNPPNHPTAPCECQYAQCLESCNPDPSACEQCNPANKLCEKKPREICGTGKKEDPFACDGCVCKNTLAECPVIKKCPVDVPECAEEEKVDVVATSLDNNCTCVYPEASSKSCPACQGKNEAGVCVNIDTLPGWDHCEPFDAGADPMCYVPKTCPATGDAVGKTVKNPTTCACECDSAVTCETGKVKNADCVCECPIEPACPEGQVKNSNTCACECPSEPECTGGKVKNPTTCACECDPGLSCPVSIGDPHTVLNASTCSCVCPVISCPSGQSQNSTTCLCEGSSSCSIGTPGDPCPLFPGETPPSGIIIQPTTGACYCGIDTSGGGGCGCAACTNQDKTCIQGCQCCSGNDVPYGSPQQCCHGELYNNSTQCCPPSKKVENDECVDKGGCDPSLYPGSLHCSFKGCCGTVECLKGTNGGADYWGCECFDAQNTGNACPPVAPSFVQGTYNVDECSCEYPAADCNPDCTGGKICVVENNGVIHCVCPTDKIEKNGSCQSPCEEPQNPTCGDLGMTWSGEPTCSCVN